MIGSVGDVADDGDAPLERLCRICLSSDQDMGKLISPCDCKGSMQYVHATCLCTWRTQQNSKQEAATKCTVCHAVYRDDFSHRSLPVRAFIRFPLLSFTLTCAILQRVLMPWLHNHAGGAAWMYMMAPFSRSLDLWHLWEKHSSLRCGTVANLHRLFGTSPGFVERFGSLMANAFKYPVFTSLVRWLLSGSMSLLVPAIADHVAGACNSDRSKLARVSEVALLVQLCQHAAFGMRAAWTRSMEAPLVSGSGSLQEVLATSVQAAHGISSFAGCGKASTTLNAFLTSALQGNSSSHVLNSLTHTAAAPVARAAIACFVGVTQAAQKMGVTNRMVVEEALWRASFEQSWGWPLAVLQRFAEQEDVVSMLLARICLIRLWAPLFVSGHAADQIQAMVFRTLTLVSAIARGARTVRRWALRAGVA